MNILSYRRCISLDLHLVRIRLILTAKVEVEVVEVEVGVGAARLLTALLRVVERAIMAVLMDKDLGYLLYDG